METGSIQLPFGFIGDKNLGGELHFEFDFLNGQHTVAFLITFKKQPYVAYLENPPINDVVKDGKVDSVALEKFLLVTDLLQDSIQENLDIIVRDGDFNNASIRQALDTKFPSVMKKQNPIEVMFKDKSKFDVQKILLSVR